MLSKLLIREYIQLDVKVENFKDAIYKSTKPLLEDQAISEGYVKEIVKIFEETGPYIVITKNIALPHAPSKSGAKKLAIGFTRLSNPVKSGNDANDPVKYLFPLSAPDGDSHLRVLSELVTLLSDETFLKKISSAREAKEIINYIENFERNGKNG